MTNNPFHTKISAKTAPPSDTEKNVLFTLGEDEKTAALDHQNAQTQDLKATTWLKIGLSVFICLLICAWGLFLYKTVSEYFQHLICLNKEIPAEVMLAIVTSGASVTGLMAFILKGIFKAN